MTVPGSVLAPKVTPLPHSQMRRQLSEDFCCWCAIGRQQSDWTKNLPKKGRKGKKLKRNKGHPGTKRFVLTNNAKRCCQLIAHQQQKIFRKLFPHLRKWERCDLGGKHRAKYCHLLLAPSFRLTPNEAKGGSPYKRVSTALKLLKCFKRLRMWMGVV